MGKRDAERGGQPVAEARAPAAAARALGLPVPEPARPALARAIGEDPVFVLDDLPHLGREHGGGHGLRRAPEAGRGPPLPAGRALAGGRGPPPRPAPPRAP